MRLLWLDTVIDAAIHRQWITSMGRRTALAHLSHLMCELYKRLEAVGQAGDCRFQLPLSQAVMGDWDRLAALAEFDPAYLRLHAEPV